MTYPNTCHTLGPFYVTTCRQADNAPVIDTCGTRSVDGWSGGGFVIRLRKTGRALVLGRIGWHAPVPSARLRMMPVVGRLFRMR